MNEWTASNHGAGKGRGQGNDSHTQIVGSLFTCQPVTPNSDDPFSFEAPKFNAKPVGPSLDHVMAKQLSPNGSQLFGRAPSTRRACSTNRSGFSPRARHRRCQEEPDANGWAQKKK
jgi:hypothetical protein